MRHQFLSAAAIVGIGSAVLFATASDAGEWGFGCGRCGSTSFYYGQPTYSYLQPTITVIPRYVVQPNYVVERTYIVPQTYYLRESAPCGFRCGHGYVVNQGQYHYQSSMTELPAGEVEEDYSTLAYPRRHYVHHRFPAPRVERDFHRTYLDIRHHRHRFDAPHRMTMRMTGPMHRNMVGPANKKKRRW